MSALHRAVDRSSCDAAAPPESLSGLASRDIADMLAGGRRFADDLRGGRVLVTGATGWFGTWLLEALVALDRAHGLGLRIVAVSRDPEAFARKHPALHAAASIEWLRADVRDALPDCAGPVTHIVHAATESHARGAATAPDVLFETIVGGTINVLKLAARHPRTKVLLIGSGAVYGPQSDEAGPIAEERRTASDPLDPRNAYAEGKRAAESLAAIWHATHGVHATLARCFAFVGPHMPFDAHFAIGNFIRDALEGRAIRIEGDGRPRRSYLYMSDLVVWLLAILVAGRPMRPYNVGAPEAITIAALAERCAAAVGGRDVQVLGRNAEGRDYVPDVTRAMRELDLAVTVPLDDAIARTAQWWTRTRDSRAMRPMRRVKD